MCGGFVGDEGCLHHIRYRSEGGLHVPENLVTLHWMYWPRCHERAHAEKRVYQPLLLQVVQRPGVTALQLLRWQRSPRPSPSTRTRPLFMEAVARETPDDGGAER